jgi:DNA-repair protein complementing XP-A cells
LQRRQGGDSQSFPQPVGANKTKQGESKVDTSGSTSVKTLRPDNTPRDPRSEEEEEKRKLESWVSGVCSKSSAGRDTGGGFLLEEDEEEGATVGGRDFKTVEDDAPALPDERMVCVECRKRFAESFLFSKFSFSVCDQCRDPKEKHSLITKTEAKQRYLLKECDFGERGGEPLPFILKRNPHGSYRTDMHLYLAIQVEVRAHEVWGGEEGLEEERERKREAREKKKEKKYVKEIQSELYI